MCTTQNYAGKGLFASLISSTVNSDQTPHKTPDSRRLPFSDALSVDEFITQNSDLAGSYPSDLAAMLSVRLEASPVQYTNLLDATALLRAFIPCPPAYTPTHYALIIRDGLIVGLVWIPVDAQWEGYAPISSFPSETRALISRLLIADAQKVIIATTRGNDTYPEFTGMEMEGVGILYNALDALGIELIDYLLIYPAENASWYYEEQHTMYDGADFDEFQYHYIGGPVLTIDSINFPAGY